MERDDWGRRYYQRTDPYDQRDTVAELLAVLNLDPQSDFKRRYGTNPGKPYRVNDSRFLNRTEAARSSIRAGKGVRLEEL